MEKLLKVHSVAIIEMLYHYELVILNGRSLRASVHLPGQLKLKLKKKCRKSKRSAHVFLNLFEE